uniref:GDT1 family protein n=1 Tax=Dunaliella tertiolecta TaxID=3047 RepID=A0A7S3RAA4_DUNTE|mmetsp:Transcript_20101/g.55956  ORF Transcript_20101/g.55956 Transcript_20101/m.55956 type:complete len:239 (+) Transcript_20101:157-873(+)|eukprot:CAMPEP_0202350334 /NCGR_PEP_ID=MMETSP1126-20121109/7449_1 /ASSEMBLY_ACC=CAM_ASM_000457 /TAXON_ID=3047 /ORGANISM="Dunaliella tertiolecta, Strain CCMP1320" /LENGTH=238 /DNA_ID=CAMNT_0048942287 /DNA_START=176 /DNA_END=892 /DNA_ORIENTATION=+
MAVVGGAAGFIKSFFVILTSEIGDKTFFIAAVMAMKSPRLTVFLGAIGALAAMTILSVALGWAAPNLIPKVYTHYAATALFFFFGFKSLYDALLKKDEGGVSELDEVEQELAADMGRGGRGAKENGGSGGHDGSKARRASRRVETLLSMVLSPIFIKSFTLTFLAEWGDRSQIATIGLAASEDPLGVTVGGILGHAICTGAAVLGGRHLAAHINEKTVAICGGILFLVFGAHSLYVGP